MDTLKGMRRCGFIEVVAGSTVSLLDNKWGLVGSSQVTLISRGAGDHAKTETDSEVGSREPGGDYPIKSGHEGLESCALLGFLAVTG